MHKLVCDRFAFCSRRRHRLHAIDVRKIILHLELHHRLQVGHFEKHSAAIVQQRGGTHFDRIMSDFLRLRHRIVLRSVLRGVTIVPLFQPITFHVAGKFAVERFGESQAQTIFVDVKFDWHAQLFARVANPFKAAVPQRAGLPAGAAHDIEMAVAQVE